MDDQSSSYIVGTLAYGWFSAVGLSSERKIMNPDNYVFFALLARLADYGYRLHPGELDGKMGILLRDPDFNF